MKRFSFRLETLLRLRRQQEQTKKGVVGGLMSRINEQQRRAVALQTGLMEEGRQLKERYLQGNVNLDLVGYYYRYATQVGQAIQRRIEGVGQIQKELMGARGELVEAARTRKVLEKLKERQQGRYDLRLRRLEQVEQDEVAARKTVRMPFGRAQDARDVRGLRYG
ncbi:MAG: flagellar FliJ family protein [Planctomycetes bacterium]|nr:flagellar FliJ family protein [Planctomycetota bacterium]